MNDYDLDDFDILEELAKIKTTVQDDQAYLSFTGKSNYENISSALGLSLDELKWLSHHEIAGLLAHQKVLSENTSDDLRLLIEKRKQGTKIFSLGAHAIHTTDKELAKKIFENKNIDLKKLFHEDIKEQTTITGISASPGRIIGKVKLVLYPDSYKQQHKEDKEHEPYDKLILVAHELTPDYTSLLGHADGVISDIGGLTSHTAVIARELNKPCIVGTKIATKLLKDGDFVEADADKGIVKILKK